MKVYIIAGEASGDLLGAAVMKSLRQSHGEALEVHGVGGYEMTREGLVSCLPMEDLSVMGFFEVIPHIFKISRHINRVVQDIKDQKPDVILTIDSPGFTHRVAKHVKRLGIPLCHLVAPSVWAWRPGRARAMAKLYDHLCCLFPFEPPYFEEVGLPTTFVGHPLVSTLQDYKKTYKPRGPLLLLPGSRKSEMRVFLPLFKRLLKKYPELSKHGVVIPTFERFAIPIKKAFLGFPVTVVTTPHERYDAMASSRLALGASGTVTLELALLGIPMIIGYRVHPLTSFLLKFLLKTPYVSLVNILLQKAVVPELLQESCTADDFATMALDSKGWKGQRPYLKTLEEHLTPKGGPSPADHVAMQLEALAQKGYPKLLHQPIIS